MESSVLKKFFVARMLPPLLVWVGKASTAFSYPSLRADMTFSYVFSSRPETYDLARSKFQSSGTSLTGSFSSALLISYGEALEKDP